MRLTDRQIDFTMEMQTLYEELLRADAADVLPHLFTAAANDDDLEVARLVGCMIVAISFAGYTIEDLARRWIELFEPCSAVH